MKNSSRLELVIARNLSRSSAGTLRSRPSSRTRSLNASQESSRLMKKRASLRFWTGACGTATTAASGGGTTVSAGGETGVAVAGGGLDDVPGITGSTPWTLHATPGLDNPTQRVKVLS